ncbi:MAG: hypothetical protein ACI9K2_006967 [Myxococcota bacterium]|jgi:hypothetical protein
MNAGFFPGNPTAWISASGRNHGTVTKGATGAVPQT